MYEILKAVAILHKSDIKHKRIKMENILLFNTDGKLVIYLTDCHSTRFFYGCPFLDNQLKAPEILDDGDWE